MNPQRQYFLRFEIGCCVWWTFSTLFCYHRKLSMVFKVTITIEWNGWGQPLGSMVFRWFWNKTTIGNDGFRWLCTIGPTMEWLCTIVEVYCKRSNCGFQIRVSIARQLARLLSVLPSTQILLQPSASHTATALVRCFSAESLSIVQIINTT